MSGTKSKGIKSTMSSQKLITSDGEEPVEVEQKVKERKMPEEDDLVETIKTGEAVGNGYA